MPPGAREARRSRAHRGRHDRSRAPRGDVRPTTRQIELEIQRDVLGARRDSEADADLTVGDLAGGTRVLPLHAHGVFALLWEAGVVDDPRRDRLALREGLD